MIHFQMIDYDGKKVCLDSFKPKEKALMLSYFFSDSKKVLDRRGRKRFFVDDPYLIYKVYYKRKIGILFRFL